MEVEDFRRWPAVLRCCGRNSGVVTNVGQVKRGVGMRTCLDEGQLIVAVQQRLRRPGQVLLRPRCVAERPVGADLDGLAGLRR